MIDLEALIETIVERKLAERDRTPAAEHITVAEYARSRSIAESTEAV